MSASDTRVTFPTGAVDGESVITRVERMPVGAVFVVEETPFHPVDHTWPDQPGDSGTISTDAGSVAVPETVMAALSDAGEFAIGADIPVKRGADGWTWLVGHLVADAVPEWLIEGATVALAVGVEGRAGLSRGHTACHLASLALDLTVADLWRKDPGTDALGNPDFEGRANQTSRISADGSVDTYRLGKSLRRAGFDTETFAATLAEREAAINAQLAAWVASAAPSRIVTEGPTIIDRRTWQCELPEGTAEIPCGGTHVDSLAEFASIAVTLDLTDPQLLVMTTRVMPAA
jgi:alanyl-tRNA synthetase